MPTNETKETIGRYHAHTVNSGWTLEVLRREEDVIEITAEICGHCGTTFSKMSFFGGENQKSLTSNDLRKIGQMFLDAAHKHRVKSYWSYVADMKRKKMNLKICQGG